MKYIALAAYKNELIIVDDMGVFTSHFCYAKKQRQGAVDLNIPGLPSPGPEDAESPHKPFLPGGLEIADDDDLLT